MMLWRQAIGPVDSASLREHLSNMPSIGGVSFDYWHLMRGDNCYLISGDGPHELKAETAIAKINKASGYWVCPVEAGYCLVAWGESATTEEVYPNLKDVASIIPEGETLYYSDIPLETIQKPMGERPITLVKTGNPITLIPAKEIIKEAERREKGSRKKRVAALMGALLFAGLAVAEYLAWPEPSPELPQVQVDPLSEYHREMDYPEAAKVLTSAQRAFWSAYSLEGWDLTSLTYTPDDGIQVNLEAVKPSLVYLQEWLKKSLFDPTTRLDAQTLTLEYTEALIERRPAKAIPVSSLSHLEQIDQLKEWEFPTVALPSIEGNGYVIHRQEITVQHPTIQFFDWLLAVAKKHPQAIIEGLDLKHQAVSWTGTVVLGIPMEANDED